MTAIRNEYKVAFRSLEGIKENLEELGVDFSLLLSNC
jgi:hypothetical protein